MKKNAFLIKRFENKHDIFYEIKQLNERKIKNIFHDNHIKKFTSKNEYFFFS